VTRLCGLDLITMSAAQDYKSYHNNTNGVPTTAGGRVMHLGVAPGEVANRIITVGSVGRAAVLCSLLEDVTTINSSRGFITHTGTYQVDFTHSLYIPPAHVINVKLI
jgi:hypothetical protein